ncbi:MAG TPA: glycoside hydrolase family 11 protein [Marinilabiliaceae bacterium]|nr:glycoside hydrolase family 11 protein [Marinilabiliaceae bacterium]
MKMNNFNKIALSFSLLLAVLILNVNDLSSQEMCIGSGSSQKRGVKDGYLYELWNQNSQGTACMTLGTGALFSGYWNGIENYLARRGLGYNQTQEHQEIGRFEATYNCNYNPSSATGNSYLSIYGWTVEPLIEYYIIEDWRNWIPSMSAGSTKKGTLTVDGGVYDIYVNTRVNQPSIKGTKTFEQYFSIRREKRTSGTIDISAHFDKWESLGLEMGKMYEVAFVVEGYKSNGSFEFTELDVSVSKVPVNIKEEEDLSQNFSVYSKPNSGSVSINFHDSFLNGSVKIFNALGKVVFSEENINSQSIMVSSLSRGLYFVNVNSDRQNCTNKFLVN